MRNVDPIPAALANFVGLGLGYVYLGRIRSALVVVASVGGMMALAGWIRFAFTPATYYFIGLIAVVLVLFPVVHCARIAVRERSIAAKRYNRWWIYLLWIIGSLIIGHAISVGRPFFFGYETFRVPSNSMAPTLRRGDYLMTDTWRFDRVDPAFGEIIVFGVPDNILYAKRLVGLPGDRIQIRNDILLRNGEAVNEKYIQLSPNGMDRARNFGPAVIPAGKYFVLGDNRHRSRDSRFLGYISRKFIHGRIEHRWFAFDGWIVWDRFPEMLADDG